MSSSDTTHNNDCALCTIPQCRKGDLCKGKRLTTMPIKQPSLESLLAAEHTKALTEVLELPEMQTDWEEDIHGSPNPNGIAKNELRASIKAAINKKMEGL